MSSQYSQPFLGKKKKFEQQNDHITNAMSFAVWARQET